MTNLHAGLKRGLNNYIEAARGASRADGSITDIYYVYSFIQLSVKPQTCLDKG